ncbi:glycerate kinase [Ureibacillus sp. FSL K6-8385]|nr:glycerate kinase [Ureibacillus terrenus]MED3662345.1 glycerate kinase [Ureibacillus terrenus]MED3764517.1 glycerate kinase [Ureibacillus terrenus]
MKILIAPDSFKGSLSSRELCRAIRHGIEKVAEAEVVEVPISDGGEGFLESICVSKPLQMESVNVKDPLGRIIRAEMAFDPTRQTAFIEMAKSTGLTLVSENERNPYQSFSYGVGDFVLHGLDKGLRTFIIGLGGSATNDAGIGMLLELGVVFLDADGNPVRIDSLADIRKIASLDISRMDSRLFDCKFILATDVNNPLCGRNGATYVFGPQKGIAKKDLQGIDNILSHYGAVLEKQFQKELKNRPGAGAAGGIPVSFLALFETEIRPGIEIILENAKLKELLPEMDFVITGEGRLDRQTFSGKVIKGICDLANSCSVPVIAICGSIDCSRQEIKKMGLLAAFSICKGPTSLEESMNHAGELAEELAENLGELMAGRK